MSKSISKTLLLGVLVFGMLGIASDSVIRADDTGVEALAAAVQQARIASLPSADAIMARCRAAAPAALAGKGVEAILDGLAAVRNAGLGPVKSALEPNKINGAKAGAAAETITCYVTDYIANITHFVNVLFPGDSSYWFNYRPGPMATEVNFYAVPLETNVVKAIAQSYSFPDGYSGGILSPFGIPLWPDGNQTGGWWVLICQTDNGDTAAWYFHVSP